MTKMKFVLGIFFLIFTSSCAMYSNEKLIGHADDLKSHERFGVCYGYGCKFYQKTGLTDAEWQTVRDVFSEATSSAEEERDVIALAVAKVEQLVGPKTGTDQDKARAIIINFSTKTQMDCIDEAFNTSTYLYLMRQEGLIKWHSLGKPIRRNFNELSYPHSSATIHELGVEKIIKGKGHYAVDSWFHKNGAPAEIIPASVWDGRWYPKEKKERYNFSAS